MSGFDTIDDFNMAKRGGEKQKPKIIKYMVKHIINIIV